MTKLNRFRDYVVDKTYIFHASGFNEPIEGKIVDIEQEAEDEVLLVIEQTDGELIKLFVKAIAGFKSKRIAA